MLLKESCKNMLIRFIIFFCQFSHLPTCNNLRIILYLMFSWQQLCSVPIFWDVMQCSQAEIYRLFLGMYYLHLQGWIYICDFEAEVVHIYETSVNSARLHSVTSGREYSATYEFFNGFSGNLIMGNFTKICQHIPILDKIRRQ